MYILTVLEGDKGSIIGANEKYLIVKGKMEEIMENKKKEGYEILSREDNYIWLIKENKDYTLSIINNNIKSESDFYALISYIDVMESFSDITIDEVSFTELEIKDYLKDSLNKLEKRKKENGEILDIILFDKNSKYLCNSNNINYYSSIHKVKIISK